MAHTYPEILNLPQYGLTLKGQFRTTEYGGVMIPEIKLLFCAQPRPEFIAEFILITHTHADQCLSLPMKIDNQIKPLVIVPAANIGTLIDYVNAVTKFKYKEYTNSKFIGANHGDTFMLGNKVHIKAYDLDHVIPCCGYGLHIIRTVLKKEYLSINRKEVINLRKEGIQLTEVVYEPVLVYLSETTVEVFDRFPELFDYPCILIECTYLPIEPDDVDEELQRSIDHKQVHWLQLYPIIQRHSNNTFILYNFSRKYTDTEIITFKDSILDKNIIFVM